MGTIEKILDGASISDWASIIENRPLLVSCSGGKDSTAVVLLMKERGLFERCHFVYADTGWEHPDLYTYIDEVLKPLCNDRLVTVKSKKYPGGFAEMVRKRGMFPSRKIRFCSQELKQFPIRDHIKDLQSQGLDVINVVGIRAQESRRRSKFEEWDRGGPIGKDVDVWRPLIDWTVQDVIDIHNRHNIKPCDLYLRKEHPSSRVGCWPCIMSKKSEIRAVAETDPARIEEIRQLEADVTEAARARYTARGETFESLGYVEPRMFQSKKYGHGDPWPIDRVVAWSRTSYGAKQFEMFYTDEPGCQMWGLCDLGD